MPTGGTHLAARGKEKRAGLGCFGLVGPRTAQLAAALPFSLFFEVYLFLFSIL
jgi:hypothetical protein